VSKSVAISHENKISNDNTCKTIFGFGTKNLFSYMYRSW